MKPCTSYVQTLFTGQDIYHWILHMTKSGRSFLSTSICAHSLSHTYTFPQILSQTKENKKDEATLLFLDEL